MTAFSVRLVDIVSSLSDVSCSFDIFFSSHVLEHVPSVKESIDFGMCILKPGELFVAFTPDGSMEFRKKEGAAWNRLWGLVYPTFFDDIYYKTAFSDKGFLISSDPYTMQEIEKRRVGQANGKTALDLDGDALL